MAGIGAGPDRSRWPTRAPAATTRAWTIRKAGLAISADGRLIARAFQHRCSCWTWPPAPTSAHRWPPTPGDGRHLAAGVFAGRPPVAGPHPAMATGCCGRSPADPRPSPDIAAELGAPEHDGEPKTSTGRASRERPRLRARDPGAVAAAPDRARRRPSRAGLGRAAHPGAGARHRPAAARPDRSYDFAPDTRAQHLLQRAPGAASAPGRRAAHRRRSTTTCAAWPRSARPTSQRRHRASRSRRSRSQPCTLLMTVSHRRADRRRADRRPGAPALPRRQPGAAADPHPARGARLRRTRPAGAVAGRSKPAVPTCRPAATWS